MRCTNHTKNGQDIRLRKVGGSLGTAGFPYLEQVNFLEKLLDDKFQLLEIITPLNF